MSDDPAAGGESWDDLQALAGIIAMVEGFGWGAEGGKLTREAIEESLDALWAAGRLPELPSLWPDEAIIAAYEDALYCGAVLFPLPEQPWRALAIETGTPVPPDAVPYLQPVQGPRPARCLLGKDHAIGWHWHNGTWWQRRMGE